MLASSLAVTPCTLSRYRTDHVIHVLTVCSCVDGSPCCRSEETNPHLDATWVSKGGKRELGGGAQTPASCLYPGGWCGIPTSTCRWREEAGERGRSVIWGCYRRCVVYNSTNLGVWTDQDITAPGTGAGHHHHHHHGHNHSHGHGGHAAVKPHTKPEDRPQSNDPSAGPTRRYRSSPYPMLAVEDALKLVDEHTPSPIVERVPVNMSLGGSVLAEDVKAAESVPAFRASIVDGYAIRIPSSGTFAKGVYPVALVSHAQAGEVQELKEGQIARITTGAPLPPGADAVIMVEDTVLASQTEDGKEEKEVEILTDEIKAGENVREVGSDVKEGDIIMKKGEGITVVGGEFGLLASVGTSEVSVYRRPVVGVLSTGDEIIPHDRPGPLRLGEVRDTNRPTLLSAIRSQNFEAVDLGIVSDKYVSTLTPLPPHSSLPQLTSLPQTRRPRIHPSHRPLPRRPYTHHRRRLNGRTRPPQAYHRALPRRHHPLRSRLHETGETHDLRLHPHQALLPHLVPRFQTHFLPPWQPRVGGRHVSSVRAPCVA